ncbi:MAG: sigma-54-dependent Fis family transcriptional regulator [Deltaproteobacteria bacterium]|nr:sigma-54-dependent Fis family transcriptional regulator [Deltaproteobacteria bacterium]
MGRVLVVDDEQSLRDVLEVLISSKGHGVRTAASVEEARRIVADEDFDLVITDLRLEPQHDGIEIVRAARAKLDPPEVILMTAFGTREKALEAQQAGALFFVEKGPHLATDMAVLVDHAIEKRKLQVENVTLRRVIQGRFRLEGIVGKSPAMKEVFDLVERIAPTKANVLISGESGTGKERIARAIHSHSEQAKGPFVPINCGAVPENLIESELFGHVKGAFTGADTNKQGLFEAATGGTIFLDEIGELPLALQPKLLRVLQERKIKPVGAVAEIDVDARVVAATNRDLEAEVRAARFREDLFFRLNVLQIDIPPLRNRVEDVPVLVQTFLERYSKEYKRPVASIEPEAMERLLAFHYPGNVRQLENIIERGVALATGPTLTLAQLPREVLAVEEGRQRPAVAVDSAAPFPEEGVDLERLLENIEYRLIRQALDRAQGVKTKAAELLSLSFRQFRYKLAKYASRMERESIDGGSS